MQVQINSVSALRANKKLRSSLKEQVAISLKKYESHITTIELKFKNDYRKKTGTDDIACSMDARLKTREHIVVSYQDEDKVNALSGALDEIIASIEKKLRKHSIISPHNSD